jgi:translation initiation factor 1A
LNPDEEKKEGAKEEELDTESEEIVRCPLPRRERGEIFALAEQLLGASKIKIVCEDQKGRLGRIPGKIRKRMWIREGDLLIVRPWEFQSDKADIVYRYTGTQSKYLSRMGKLPETVNVF